MEDEKVKGFKGLKKQAIFLMIMAFLVVGVLTSYALFSYNFDFLGNQGHSISTCSLDLNFEDKNPITLLSAIPISDSEADSLDPYLLTIKNNGSGCSTLNYTFTMVDFCLSCQKNNGVCAVGENSCDCRDGYKIDSSKIKFSVKDVETGDVVNGVDPYNNLNIVGGLATSDASHSYEIKLWISSDAVNSDLYVSNGSGGYLTNEDGSFVTKNFCSKVNLEVAAE